MAKEKATEFNVDLDAFMSNLASTSSRKERKIEKYNLGFPNEKGNYFYLLFPHSGNDFIYNLGKVKEFKGFSTKRGKDVWFDILNKKDYGELTDDQAKLYDEVVKLYAQVEKLDSNIDAAKWQLKHTRTKTFVLTFAHVIKFINHDSGIVDKEKINKAALLVVPSSKFMETFSNAINSKNSIMGNNKWLLKILTNDPKNREAIVITDFYGGQGGYNVSVSFEMDKDAVKSMLPENYDFTSERDIFAETNIVREFLGWQAPEEGTTLFDEEMFKELRLRMLDIIHPVTETPLASQPSTTSQPSPSKLDNVVQDSEDDLPF